LYVLADYTGKYKPEAWARRAYSAYEDFSADAIVVESTYGKDMVTHVMNNSGFSGYRLITVDSRRGKELRAEPIVALYEKNRVVHVGKRGDLASLEDEQTTWVPGQSPSPNRVDALVHGATELAKVAMPVMVADPAKLLTHGRVPTNRYLGGFR
jgi:phage terminase large subunit-like protein